MSDPEITVLIPSYNRAAYIEDAIASVLKQTYQQWKLLVIDDASTDDTIQKITPYLMDRRVSIHSLKENVGISHVLNKGLGLIDTEFFVQLDSDDWLEKDALEQFVLSMREDPQAALYYANVRLWAEDGDGIWKKKKTIRHRLFTDKYEFLIYLTYMLHPRCYRTDAVRNVGGWETDDLYHGRIMEDRRMCVKLIEKYRFHWTDQILYNRRKHRQQLTNRKMFKARNKLRKELVINSLQRWGNEFAPVFGFRNGLLIVKRLDPK